MKHLFVISRKEFKHIFRDPRSLMIILIMPLVMIVIYGYAITLDLNRVDMAVVDFSNSTESRQIIKSFHNHSVFVVRELTTKNISENPILRGEFLIKSGKFDEILIFPPDFAPKLHRREPTRLAIIIDGSDSNIAILIRQLNEKIIADAMREKFGLEHLIRVGIKIFYNPEVKSYFFIIPGIVAILMLLLSASLTSISISREKENGSIFLLFISPLRPSDIIIGKTLPYITVALVEGIIMLLTASIWFHLPIRGSLAVLGIFSLLYIITGLSFGILISVWATSQRSAMLSTLLIALLPSIMLTGFIFPLHSLSPILRGISYMIPTTYFLRIIRGIVLTGAGFEKFIIEGLILLIYGVVLIWAAGLKFVRMRGHRA